MLGQAGVRSLIASCCVLLATSAIIISVHVAAASAQTAEGPKHKAEEVAQDDLQTNGGSSKHSQHTTQAPARLAKAAAARRPRSPPTQEQFDGRTDEDREQPAPRPGTTNSGQEDDSAAADSHLAVAAATAQHLAPSNGTSWASSLAKRKLMAKPSMLNLALVNGKVSLPCDISPASADDSVALILWYKDDSLAPIYTIDARKASSLDRAKLSIDEAYTNRASFNMKSRPAQLQLNPVKQDDEGDYRCRVDFKRGRTVNTIISLRVIILPEDIRIVSPQRMQGSSGKLEGLIGPFNEGSELTLVCLVTGGKPRPQITWRRDFNVIDKTYQHLDKDGTSNELKISSLNKNHLLSMFTCQASNNNLTSSSPLQSSITLDLNLKPQEVSLKQVSQEPLVIGQTATFECVSHGSRPQATIHWLFQGIRHDTPMNVDQQQTSSRITLTLQQSFNQQPLTCVAENPRIPQSSALRQTLQLDVHYPPQLSIRLEHQPQLQPQPNNLSPNAAAAASSAPGGEPQEQSSQASSSLSYLQEGNDIYLTCQMDANPRPMKPILWRFNGKPMPQQQSSNMIVMNNQSLVLRKVSRHQSGNYSCDATNQHGNNSSKPLELIIRHAPICSTDDILIFEANIGNVINIDCNVIANPSKSVHYSWFFGSALSGAGAGADAGAGAGATTTDNNNNNLSALILRDAALDEQIDESGSRLQYKIKDENSFGLLKCKAKNAIGLQQKACLFQISRAQLPILRHGCSLMNVSSTNLQVKCDPNEHLKSEDFELVANRDKQQQSIGSSAGRMASWVNNLDAMRQQHQHQQPDGQSGWRQSSNELSLTMRLVYPPTWLMAELYKSTSGGDSSSEASYSLSAYIVIGASSQLPIIKSIVEENHLFSTNPKSVYYVIAKQTNSSSANRTSNSLIDQNKQNAGMNENVPLIPRQFSSGGRSIIEDPSIQIANSFAFTIPSLEPQTKYKLLIYGQNLANKTRDWLIVRAETKTEESGYESRSQIQSTAPIRTEFTEEGKVANTGMVSLAASNQTSLKSIVMRSDTDQTSSNDEPNSMTDDQTSTPGRLTARNNLSLIDRVQQLGFYKDYAISYAKQKPLLAVPMAASIILVLVLFLTWTAGFLVHCLSSSQGRRPQRKSSVQGPSDSPSSPPSTDRSVTRRSSTDKSDLRQQQQQLNHYTHTSPDNSSDSNSHQASSSRSKRDILSNENGQPLMDGTASAASCNIYTISEPKNFNQNLYSGQTLDQQQLKFMGSLDRRQVHHYHQSLEPIYLTDAGGEIFQLQQNGHYHIGSIDRRTGFIGSDSRTQPFSQQTSLMLANPSGMGPLEQGGVHIQRQQQQQRDQAMNSPRCSQQSEHYNGSGSFSSTHCSSSTINQSVQVNTMVIPAPRSIRQQKVAFDLSNQKQHRTNNHSPNISVESSIAADNRRLLIVSPTSLDGTEDIAQIQYSHSHLPRDQTKAKQGSMKGSDSGGSNSANTADSGHESPPTGETIIHSGSSNSDIKYQLNPDRHLFIVGGQAADNSISDDNRHHGIHYYNVSDGFQQQNAANQMMMLMELSPGSQESSATMIQSVDSLENPIQLQMINNNRFPENLHQVATSFTSNNSDINQQGLFESREKEHTMLEFTSRGDGRLKQHQHGSPAKLWL